jgi:hypothetical protein
MQCVIALHDLENSGTVEEPCKKQTGQTSDLEPIFYTMNSPALQGFSP